MITSARLLILVSILSGLGAFSAPLVIPIKAVTVSEPFGKDFNFGPELEVPPGGFPPPKATPTVHLPPTPGKLDDPVARPIPPPGVTDSSSSIVGSTGFVTVYPRVTKSAAPSAHTAISDATPKVAKPSAGGSEPEDKVHGLFDSIVDTLFNSESGLTVEPQTSNKGAGGNPDS